MSKFHATSKGWKEGQGEYGKNEILVSDIGYEAFISEQIQKFHLISRNKPIIRIIADLQPCQPLPHVLHLSNPRVRISPN
jgi:hypothetical protein